MEKPDSAPIPRCQGRAREAHGCFGFRAVCLECVARCRAGALRPLARRCRRRSSRRSHGCVRRLRPRPRRPPAARRPTPDPRAGRSRFEQAQRLMKAVDAILQDAAKNRGEAKKLPSEGDFLLKPLWTETREDREKKIRDLLDAAHGHRHRRAGGRRAEEDRGAAQEHPRARRPHRRVAREAADGAQGRHAARLDHRHGRQPRQGHRGGQEAHRGQPRGDRQGQGGSARGAQRRPASSWRPSRSTCCSTACFPATWCAWWRCSTPPS